MAWNRACADNLTDCIGCDCLSLRSCAIFNPSDSIADRGACARYLLGGEKVATRPVVTPPRR